MQPLHQLDVELHNIGRRLRQRIQPGLPPSEVVVGQLHVQFGQLAFEFLQILDRHRPPFMDF